MAVVTLIRTSCQIGFLLTQQWCRFEAGHVYVSHQHVFAWMWWSVFADCVYLPPKPNTLFKMFPLCFVHLQSERVRFSSCCLQQIFICSHKCTSIRWHCMWSDFDPSTEDTILTFTFRNITGDVTITISTNCLTFCKMSYTVETGWRWSAVYMDRNTWNRLTLIKWSICRVHFGKSFIHRSTYGRKKNLKLW